MPLAGDRRVGVGGDRHLAGLGATALRASLSPVTSRLAATRRSACGSRAEVLPVEAEVRLELIGLAEPRRVGGRVGDPGGERERGQHAEHARDRAGQRRPDRQRGPAAARLEREPGADQHRDGAPGLAAAAATATGAGAACARPAASAAYRGRGRPGQHQQRDERPSRCRGSASPR